MNDIEKLERLIHYNAVTINNKRVESIYSKLRDYYNTDKANIIKFGKNKKYKIVVNNTEDTYIKF